jgi:crotonobetainyl-CoA:carnitine CoA-transferase CaiB-like acyl-CoA transferase
MALLDVQVTTFCNQSQNYLASTIPPGRYGNAHASVVLYHVFRTRDRDFIIASSNDAQFVALCESQDWRSFLQTRTSGAMPTEWRIGRTLSRSCRGTFSARGLMNG